MSQQSVLQPTLPLLLALCITDSTFDEALRSQDEVVEIAERVKEEFPKVRIIGEWRSDYVHNLRAEQVRRFREHSNLELMFTPRSTFEASARWRENKHLGFQGTMAKKLQLYKIAIECGFQWFDIELSTVYYTFSLFGNQRWKSELKENLSVLLNDYQGKARQIISYHDFLSTPKLDKIRSKFMQEIDAGILPTGKVACMANKDEDVASLMYQVLDAHIRKLKIIGIPMGEVGKVGRVLSLMYGSELGYAARKSQSAPGQIYVWKMIPMIEKAYEIFEKRGWKDDRHLLATEGAKFVSEMRDKIVKPFEN